MMALELKIDAEKSDKQIIDSAIICTKNDISNCGHLIRLCQIMQSYDGSMIKSNITLVLNDYLHLVHKHNDDEQFEDIVNKFGHCSDIKSCNMFGRNHRNRHNLTDNNEALHNLYSSDKDVISRLQIYDKIHCYFCHCYDIGNKISPKDKLTIFDNMQDAKNDDLNDVIINQQIIKMSKIIKEKSKQYWSMNKYHQLFISENKENEDDKMYHFGVEFNYGVTGNEITNSNLKTEKRAVQPRHSSLKEELLGNDISRIGSLQYDAEYAKAEIHNESDFKKEYYPDMTIEYILALMVYCNYTMLQYEFSKTYRENIDKHGSFYYMGKFLKISVYQHGSTIAKGVDSKFYHGISEQLLFPEIIGQAAAGVVIYSPLSTSASIEVATSFANGNYGIVIEFGSGSYKKSAFPDIIKYFNVQWLSDFGNEGERLFIQNIYPLVIRNITDCQTGQEYKPVIDAMFVVDDLMGGEEDEDKLTIIDKMHELSVSLVKDQLSDKVFNFKKIASLTSYARKMFKTYCENRYLVKIKFAQRGKYWMVFELFGCLNNEWVNLEWIITLFPKLEEIILFDVKLCDEVMQLLYENMKELGDAAKKVEISITAHSNATLNIEQAITEYKSWFESINVTIKPEHDTETFGEMLCVIKQDY